LREAYVEVDSKKLARNPTDSEKVSEEKISEITKTINSDDETKASEPVEMDTDEPDAKKPKTDED